MNRATLFTAVLLAALPAAGQNIITITGTPTNSPPNGVAYSSWTQTGTFNNVTIQANVYSCFGVGNGTAYLTLNGRNAANQVAVNPSVSVNGGNTGAAATVTLFSGLNLGPGTYYLTLNPSGGNECNVIWNSTSTPTATTGTGVTNNGSGLQNGAVNAYPPATNFKSGWFFLYSATGSGAGTSVPTLTEWGMALMAMLLLGSGLILTRKYRPQE